MKAKFHSKMAEWNELIRWKRMYNLMKTKMRILKRHGFLTTVFSSSPQQLKAGAVLRIGQELECFSQYHVNQNYTRRTSLRTDGRTEQVIESRARDLKIDRETDRLTERDAEHLRSQTETGRELQRWKKSS